MAKVKTVYMCNECGASHSKWSGQCNSCGLWNTLTEEIQAQKVATTRDHIVAAGNPPKPLSEIGNIAEKRLVTPDSEMNRILGGGIVAGSIVLLGGEPGIGKSTLMLQLALQLKDQKVLYISGEESEAQIKMRAQRIPYSNPALLIAGETRLESILKYVETLKPDILIIDSIQTIYSEAFESAPGSISQVRECASRLMRLAKQTHVPVFLVGHITKDGMLAGPKVLEHMVDTVLSFEGDRHNNYRIVRTAKNRFGSTLELGIYEMQHQGLREVSNPSELFISLKEEQLSGVAVSATMEGMRPLLMETQALVSPTNYGNAQRSATGFDLKRLNMLLAVLEKRAGFKLGPKDVFVNLTGGIRIEDPALDLGLACSIVSSLHDIPVSGELVFAAEIGLSGELRPVNRIEQRISEAEKLGFKQIFISEKQLKGAEKGSSRIKVTGCSRLDQVFRQIFA